MSFNLFSTRHRIAKEFHAWAREKNKEICNGKVVDESDVGNFLVFLESKDYINDKEIPKQVTHEATFKELRTCPRCKNIISRTETWGDSEIMTIPNYCPYCGQHLKGENEQCKKLV